MTDKRLPQWLLVVLTLVGIVVLGPPALGLLLGLIGLTIGLAAVALKLALWVAAAFVVVAIVRALFGSSRRSGAERVRVPASLESLDQEYDARRAAEKAALDAELERSLAAQR